MTANDLIAFRDNKDSDIYYWLIKEVTELKHEVTCLRNQTDCMQKSIANIRKDISSCMTEPSRFKDKSFWIHW